MKKIPDFQDCHLGPGLETLDTGRTYFEDNINTSSVFNVKHGGGCGYELSNHVAVAVALATARTNWVVALGS